MAGVWARVTGLAAFALLHNTKRAPARLSEDIKFLQPNRVLTLRVTLPPAKSAANFPAEEPEHRLSSYTRGIAASPPNCIHPRHSRYQEPYCGNCAERINVISLARLNEKTLAPRGAWLCNTGFLSETFSTRTQGYLRSNTNTHTGTCKKTILTETIDCSPLVLSSLHYHYHSRPLSQSSTIPELE